jgi:hypothetical protein
MNLLIDIIILNGSFCVLYPIKLMNSLRFNGLSRSFTLITRVYLKAERLVFSSACVTQAKKNLRVGPALLFKFTSNRVAALVGRNRLPSFL